MKPLDMQAEPYVATGNIASEGMRNQLGRPRLDRLSLLVREAAQNSWDAKSECATSVTFGLQGWTLNAKQFGALQKTVFAQRPPRHAYDVTEAAALGDTLRERAAKVRDGEGIVMLAVYDRGTSGLGGPTRADSLRTDQPRDFVDFFRNIGTPPDKARGGGTFGYGKAALYLSSEVHTLPVHTRCRTDDGLQSRFMGSGLTNHYSHEGRNLTGRHWWGRRDPKSGIVDPLVGEQADQLADLLGFPSFERNSTGTTIGILAPHFDPWEEEPERAFEYMSWQLLLNLWPKMVPWPGEKQASMRFELSWEGKTVAMPGPADTPPFDGFVRALQQVREAEKTGDASKELFCLRPKRRVGRFAAVRTPTQRTGLSDFAEAGTVPDIHTRAHHVALLRRPELVVEYKEFPALPSDTIGYAGVFLADPDMDRVFAGAEPPTHDSWSPEIIADRRHKTFVRTTFKRIDEKVAEFIEPHREQPDAVAGGPLAELAEHLGEVLIGAGSSPEQEASSAGGGKGGGRRRGPKPKVRVHDTRRFSQGEGLPTRLFEVELRHAKGSRASRLTAKLSISLLGGGVESTPPRGARKPRVAFWGSPSGERFDDTDSVDAVEEGTWELGVAMPRSALVAVDVVAEGESTP